MNFPPQLIDPIIAAGLPGVFLVIVGWYAWKLKCQVDELHQKRHEDQEQFLGRYLSVMGKVEGWMQVIQKGHEEQVGATRRGNEIMNDLTREIRDMKKGGQ